MARRKSRYRVLVYEAVGFATILVVTWMDEFFGFPEEYLGGELPAPEWVGGAVETAAILAVAIPTLLLTRRLISRLFYLEGFLTVCAWCRKINVDERWISMEDYFASGFRTRTSHGMCPDCFEEATRKMT